MPDETETNQSIETLETPSYAIAEGNLYRNHFASLAPRSAAKTEKINEVVEKGRNEKGVAYARKWKVIGGVEYGYPNWLDEKVLVGVIDLGRRHGFPVRNPIQVRINELCRHVGLDHESGRNREMVRTSLKRIRDVTIEASGALFYKRKKAWIDDRFSVLQRVIFAGENLEDGTQATCTLVWLSDKILDNINDCHFVPIDTRFFMRLSPTAGRLYELLSTRFFGLLINIKRREGERDGAFVVETYSELCRRMPLEPQTHRSRGMQQFEVAHKELLRAGFLSKVEWLESNELRYYPGVKALYDFDNAWREVTQQLNLPLDTKSLAKTGGEPLTLEIEGPRRRGNSPVTLQLLPDALGPVKVAEGVPKELAARYKADLKSRGVSAQRAKDLIAEYAETETVWNGRVHATIDFYIQYFDWMLATDHPKKPESGAWLVKAIREEWLPPLEFKTKEETEEGKRAAEAEKKRREQAEKDREEADRRKRYFEWLRKTPEERWRADEFAFRFQFRRDNGRDASAQDMTEARTAYLAAPETPEAYQIRLYGKVRYPLTLEQNAPQGAPKL